MPTSDAFSTDVLIIGAGAAGLSAALALAPRMRVLVVAKSTANEGSTFYAQGGIAAVT
ncbi:MAG: FAD-dependent oxidoreductase, partial [Gammaproteobacteria bacterium]|nr:FAD-dependent oxidoreductase [Gammaproteobacteria bacterium]